MGSQVGIARPTRAGLWQMTLDIEKKRGWPFLSAARALDSVHGSVAWSDN